jgi:peroxiredoxin
VAGGLLLAFLTSGGVHAAAKEGEPFPALSLADVQTGTVKELGAAFRGAVGAVVYMQTSCAACRKEMTALKDLQVKFPQFKVVVVSVDSGSPERVARYREHFGFEFPFFQDPDFKTPELFGFSFTPALVLVDKEGKIALLKGGYRPGDEVDLEKRIGVLTAK